MSYYTPTITFPGWLGWMDAELIKITANLAFKLSLSTGLAWAINNGHFVGLVRTRTQLGLKCLLSNHSLTAKVIKTFLVIIANISKLLFYQIVQTH